MRLILLVFLGGGFGSVLRFLLATHIQRAAGLAFPWGTLAVNVCGCLVIGGLWAWSARANPPFNASAFIFAGILGGFTTFSSFGLETFHLLHNGAWQEALLYVVATNALGLLGVAAGFWFVIRFTG